MIWELEPGSNPEAHEIYSDSMVAEGPDTIVLPGWVKSRSHARCTLAPHCGQNFVSEGISLPHDPHFIEAFGNLM